MMAAPDGGLPFKGATVVFVFPTFLLAFLRVGSNATATGFNKKTIYELPAPGKDVVYWGRDLMGNETALHAFRALAWGGMQPAFSFH